MKKHRKHGLFYPVTNRFGVNTPLLYWHREGLHVALTSSEQAELLYIVAGDAFPSHLHIEKHRETLLEHLTTLMTTDRARFIKRYVYRHETGDAACDILPAMVVGYSIVSGHARFEYYGARTIAQLFDTGVFPVLPLRDVYTIHLVGNRRWPFQKGQLTVGALLVPVSAIREVNGTIKDFLLTTDTNWIRFAPGGVFVVDRRAKGEWRSLEGENPLEVMVPV